MNMSQKKWKVALVGCGSIAGEIYLPQLATFPDVEVVAVCDIMPERAQASWYSTRTLRRCSWVTPDRSLWAAD